MEFMMFADIAYFFSGLAAFALCALAVSAAGRL
jgi:hypothetical protein